MLLSAYQDLTTITAANIGMKEVPEHHVPQSGVRTPVSLRGAIGVGAVVYSIVTTVDALLASTRQAEDVFVGQIATHYDRKTLPTTEPRRSKRVRSIVEKSGYPRLGSVALVAAQLKARGVFT
jgi:hypothetical protein